MVPALLLLGNKPFGMSSNLKHICAMCSPIKVDFFAYDWKKESWNLVILLGTVLGGFIAYHFLMPSLTWELADMSFSEDDMSIKRLVNSERFIFSWENLLSLQGLVFIVFGGFFVGFGSRYADGCTSGHAIMGLSIQNWPSLVAVAGFFAGGLISTHWIIPYFLS
jgi:uncharacterized membrane protein YedE/YeeE